MTFHPAWVMAGRTPRGHGVRMGTSFDDVARAFTPAHAGLARSAGVPAALAGESYVKALASVVYYWGYPAVDTFGRTSMWALMDGKAGLHSGSCRAHRRTAPERWLIT